MNGLFADIEKVVSPLPGWCPVEKSIRMGAIVLALNSKVSVEIGVYGGRSFMGMALAHKAMGTGLLIGIDPWKNDAAMAGYDGANREFWQRNPLEQIYRDFMALIYSTGTQNVTKILREKSDDVLPESEIDVLHVDGQHTEQAVTDVKRFAANVRIGGIVIMDDLSWTNGKDLPVLRASKALEALGFQVLYSLGTGGVFQRLTR